jgi:acetoacetate decarboxylase
MESSPSISFEVVPEALEVADDTIAYEFIRMPDSTDFGDYSETGHVIPVGEVVSGVHYGTDLTLGLGEVVFDYLKDA